MIRVFYYCSTKRQLLFLILKKRTKLHIHCIPPPPQSWQNQKVIMVDREGKGKENVLVVST